MKCPGCCWCNLVRSSPTSQAGRYPAGDVFQARRDKDHTGFCILSSVKLKTVFYTFRRKQCEYNVQAFHSPLQRTYFSPTLGCTWSLGGGPILVGELPPSKIPWGKNKFTCAAKGAFTGQSVRENAFPFTQLSRGGTPNGGASSRALEGPGSNPRREEKRGKLTPWALPSQNHK